MSQSEKDKGKFPCNVDFLSNLQLCYNKMDEIGLTMRREEQVYQVELADRLAKGLTGDAAIKHYNEWMEKFGMAHLKVNTNCNVQ